MEPARLVALLEAARWAPSSYNEQPWHFIVAPRAETESFDRLLGCLSRGNASWAGKAPVLMLAVAQLVDEDGDPNRHAFYDVGQAVAQMALQALDLGLYMHQMAGFDVEKAQQVFAVPEQFEPAAAIALGYLGDPAGLPERYREGESDGRAAARPWPTLSSPGSGARPRRWSSPEQGCPRLQSSLEPDPGLSRHRRGRGLRIEAERLR